MTQADSVRPSRDEGTMGDYGGTGGKGGGAAKGLSRLSPSCVSVSDKNFMCFFLYELLPIQDTFTRFENALKDNFAFIC